MYGCLVVVKTITNAQKIKKILETHGYEAHIIRSPREISPGGCGYALSINQNKMSDILMLLKNQGSPDYKVYVYFDHAYREAKWAVT